MDYVEGAIDVPRPALIACLLRHGGNPRPGNSTFSALNLYDLIEDGRYYALTPARARAFVEQYARPRTWKTSRRDCDSRTKAMAADFVDAADELGWELGMAALWVSYLSATLGKPHDTPLAGYHQAMLIFVWDGTAGEVVPWVVQPPYPGREAVWQSVAEELKPRGWVIAGGLT